MRRKGRGRDSGVVNANGRRGTVKEVTIAAAGEKSERFRPHERVDPSHSTVAIVQFPLTQRAVAAGEPRTSEKINKIPPLVEAGEPGRDGLNLRNFN